MHPTYLFMTWRFFVIQIGPRCSAAEAIPAIVDRVEASRYRFYAAADGPGRACGPANIKMFVLGIQSSTTCSCNAATAAMVDLPIFLCLFFCGTQQCPEAM